MARSALVVDDSNSMRIMVATVLRDHGFEVVEAANGRAPAYLSSGVRSSQL